MSWTTILEECGKRSKAEIGAKFEEYWKKRKDGYRKT